MRKAREPGSSVDTYAATVTPTYVAITMAAAIRARRCVGAPVLGRGKDRLGSNLERVDQVLKAVYVPMLATKVRQIIPGTGQESYGHDSTEGSRPRQLELLAHCAFES